MTSRDYYRHAKLQHYLDRALEYMSASRYAAAERMLQAATKLEPENKQCSTLMGQIQQLTHPRGQQGADVTEPETEEKRRGGIVLLVDQDERVLASLSECLRRYGFITIGAGSYEEAMEVLSTTEPAVIVSEVNFESGPRGFDLYTHVKTNGFSCDMPFLFMTTRLDKNMLIAGKRFGVDDFLLKPVDPDVVAASVMSCITRHHQHA